MAGHERCRTQLRLNGEAGYQRPGSRALRAAKLRQALPVTQTQLQGYPPLEQLDGAINPFRATGGNEGRCNAVNLSHKR